MSDDPLSALDRISARLADGATAPAALVEELRPRSRADAITWARRLPCWDEFRGRYPDRVIALARLITRRAMREHDLVLTEDGRVTDRCRETGRRPAPAPTRVFALTVGGAEVRVEYTRDYCPFGPRDHIQFKSPHDPAQPIPLSPTGWYSHFADRDAVEVCGGAEQYAALFATARCEDREDEFVAEFEGPAPTVTRQRRQRKPNPGSPARPVVGPHTGEAVGTPPPADDEQPPPGRLF